MAAASLADRLRAEIERDGPLAVSRFVDAALYDATDGFYATGGQAGRRGDFITAPEVGPLFGAVISNAVDTWWHAAGEPETFVVAEHGAGPGTLARTVTVAGGACLAAGALRWVMVERSDAQRRQQPEGDHLRSVSDGDALDQVDVVLANELLDNVAFDLVARRDHGWVELRIGVDAGGLTVAEGNAVAAPPGAEDAATGAVLPVIDDAVAWVAEQRRRHPNARVAAFDYAAPTAELLTRGDGWLRAYRDHTRVVDWLTTPGSCDITIDLPVEQVAVTGPSRIESQATFLRRHGIEELVEEGRRLWADNAHVGDLAALRARSRITESEALLDPAGMGGFSVFEWGSGAT